MSALFCLRFGECSVLAPFCFRALFCLRFGECTILPPFWLRFASGHYSASDLVSALFCLRFASVLTGGETEGKRRGKRRQNGTDQNGGKTGAFTKGTILSEYLYQRRSAPSRHFINERLASSKALRSIKNVLLTSALLKAYLYSLLGALLYSSVKAHPSEAHLSEAHVHLYQRRLFDLTYIKGASLLKAH